MRRALLLFALLLFARTAFAADKYIKTVADGGDDLNNCLSAGAACHTFNRVLPLLAPGDTVHVYAGDYRDQQIDNGGDNCPSCVDGSMGSEITIEAEAGAVVSVGAIAAGRSYYNFYDIDIDMQCNLVAHTCPIWHNPGLFLTGTHILYQGLTRRVEIKNTWFDGIAAEAYGPSNAVYQSVVHVDQHDSGAFDWQEGLCPSSTHVQIHGAYWSSNYGLISDVWFHNNTQCFTESYGLQFFDGSSGSLPHNNVLKNSKFYDNGRGITSASGAHDNLIHNNLFYSELATSIDLNNEHDDLVYNNTIVGNAMQAVNAVSPLIKNNILQSADINIYGGSGITIQKNVLFSSAVNVITSTSGLVNSGNDTGDPLLVSVVDPINFSIDTGSSAIGLGANFSSLYTTDFAGNMYPAPTTAWDSGAYIFNGSGACTPDHLAFTSQPTSAAIGASLGTVHVGIYDSGDNLCTSATNTVTFAKHGSATWNSLQVTTGSLVKSPSAGIATINTMFVSPTTGSGSITATGSGGIGTITSDSITISAAPTDPCAGPPCTFYIDFVDGDDSYSGLDKTHPWKHAPGMPNATGGPNAIATPMGVCHPSDCDMSDYQFIFKGGVTWDDTNRDWFIQTKGTSGHPVYYGVDPSWYTGGSWSRPKFDWGGEAAGCFVSLIGTGGRYVTIFQTFYVWMDNFEFFDGWWDNSDACMDLDTNGEPYGFGYVVLYTGGDPHHRLTNIYMHDWSHPADYNTGTISWPNGSAVVSCTGGGCSWDSTMLRRLFFHPIDAIETTVPSVISVGDSTHITLDTTNAGSTVTGTYRLGVYDSCELLRGERTGVDQSSTLEDSVIDGSDAGGNPTGMTSCQLNGSPVIIIRNWLGLYSSWSRVVVSEFGWNTCYRTGRNYSTQHDQCMQASRPHTSKFHDNFLYHEPGEGAGQDIVFAPDDGGTTYVYNNVAVDAEGQEYFACAGITHAAMTGKCSYYNNTFQNTRNVLETIVCGTEASGVCPVKNIYMIGPYAAATITDCLAATTYNSFCDPMLGQSSATAESDTNGIAEYYTPKTGGATIGAGENLSSLCVTLTTLCYSSARGVTLNATTHTVSISVPNPVQRPLVGDWDIGAYQFNSLAPQILSASPDHGAPANNYDVLITGSGTSWDETSEISSSCAELVPLYSTTYNVSSILGTYAVTPGTASKYCDIVVTTGMEVLTLTNGFHIIAPAVQTSGGSTHIRLSPRR